MVLCKRPTLDRCQYVWTSDAVPAALVRHSHAVSALGTAQRHSNCLPRQLRPPHSTRPSYHSTSGGCSGYDTRCIRPSTAWSLQHFSLHKHCLANGGNCKHGGAAFYAARQACRAHNGISESQRWRAGDGQGAVAAVNAALQRSSQPPLGPCRLQRCQSGGADVDRSRRGKLICAGNRRPPSCVCSMQYTAERVALLRRRPSCCRRSACAAAVRLLLCTDAVCVDVAACMHIPETICCLEFCT